MTGEVQLPPGQTLIHLPETASTNQFALEMIARGDAEDGLIVWADRQTAGRGRQGREWLSLPGNLLVSFVVDPGRSLGEAAQLSFVAALSVADTVCTWQPAPESGQVTCKWPNDVLISGRKCAGILLETATPPGGAGPRVVIGIGLNLANAPETAQYPTTAIERAWGIVVEPASALEVLARRLDHWRSVWQASGFSAVREAWMGLAHGIGQPVAVRLANREQSGMFAGIDDTGALRLETADGIETVSAGDVHFVNPRD